MKYSTVTMKIQLDLLVDFLKQIGIYDSTEDLKIREHLRICTIHHISLTEFLHLVQRYAELPILILPVTGLFAVLVCLVYIYYHNSIIISVFLILTLSLEALLVVDICTSCQDVEYAFEQFFSILMNLKWYHWNESNKRSLLVMMTRSQKSAAIQAFNVQVNRGLIIRVFANLAVEYINLGSTSAEKIGLEWYWDIETASPSSRNKINEEITRVFITYAITTMLNTIGAVFNFIIECFTDIHYICDKDFISKWFAGIPSLKFLLTCLLSSAHSVVALTAISQYLVMKYVTVTMKIQLDLLVDFLKQIGIYDSTEDLNIREHLRICAVHHISITKFLQVVQGHADLPVLFLPISGIFSVLGCLVYIYYNNSTITIVALVIQLSLGGLLVVDMCKSCQDVEDSFDKLFSNLMKLKWYQWNESNKKSLLVMMTRSQKSATIQSFNIQVNRGLIIRFARAVYQIFLIIKQTM
ncbi:hypothetical protein WA026_020072 [Henosepilachna vigintioctopunctata]|uniref:Odorant receptor n=1 Tax=Henosepilachna vigintioctopunctata TaxID=420089 RepID=A0AAW1U5Q3_9CUCU